MTNRQRMAVLLAAATVLACIGSIAASAEVRTMTTRTGVPLRLNAHTYFSFSTCASMGLPQISGIKVSDGGKIWHQPEMTNLGSSASPKGNHCVGKSIQSAVVYYQPKPDWTGTERIEYRVKYPPSCTDCKDRDVTIAINVLPPSAPPAPAPETGSVDQQTPQMSGSTFRKQRPPRGDRDASTN
jgi:hypothetical protein